MEYDSSYVALPPFTNPFRLCYYNTTINAYTLAALRMGTVRSKSLMRWVWEANRGKPVRENATFSLCTDGNLVLAEADGTVVKQTNTVNKGVVGFELHLNENMVLHDAKGNSIWQSFNFLTDTLFVEQSLRADGVGPCNNNQCVAFPTPNGLIGWSENCESKKVTSCKASDFHYYKLQGVDHFTIKHTKGDEPMKQNDCESKCTRDCKCLAYFYHMDCLMCGLDYELKTFNECWELHKSCLR